MKSVPFSLLDELTYTSASGGFKFCSDLTVVVGGGRAFATHRLLLASISELLESLLVSVSGPEEEDDLVLICPDLDTPPMETFLSMLSHKEDQCLVDTSILELCSLLGVDITRFLDEVPATPAKAEPATETSYSRIEPLLSHQELDELLKYGEISDFDCILVVSDEKGNPRRGSHESPKAVAPHTTRTGIAVPTSRLPHHQEEPPDPPAERTASAAEEEDAGGGGVFPCDVCQKACATEQQLRYHRVIHAGAPVGGSGGGGAAGGETGRCLVCGKVLSRDYLNHHLREVHFLDQVKKFCCELCGRNFMRRAKYEGHMSSCHGAPKRHVCTVCGKQFSVSSDMYKHRAQVHLAQPALPCPVCGKLFKTRERLRRHELLHTSVSAWQCEVCLRQFSRKDKLKAHMRTKHE